MQIIVFKSLNKITDFPDGQSLIPRACDDVLSAYECGCRHVLCVSD